MNGKRCAPVRRRGSPLIDTGVALR